MFDKIIVFFVLLLLFFFCCTRFIHNANELFYQIEEKNGLDGL